MRTPAAYCVGATAPQWVRTSAERALDRRRGSSSPGSVSRTRARAVRRCLPDRTAEASRGTPIAPALSRTDPGRKSGRQGLLPSLATFKRLRRSPDRAVRDSRRRQLAGALRSTSAGACIPPDSVRERPAPGPSPCVQATPPGTAASTIRRAGPRTHRPPGRARPSWIRAAYRGRTGRNRTCASPCGAVRIRYGRYASTSARPPARMRRRSALASPARRRH